MRVAVQNSSLAASESRRGTDQTIHSDAYCAEEYESETEKNWSSNADDSTTSAAHTGSSSAPKQVPEAFSLVFQYFSLLAAYHGAVHVPPYWANLVSSSSVAGTNDDDASTCEHAQERAEKLISPVTEIDLSVCYVGPTMLLALADLLRVHSVTVQRGRSQRCPVPGKEGIGTLPSVMAPLWGAGSRRPNKGEEVMCSLLPNLTTLRLTHLAMDFTVPYDATGPKGRNSVLRNLLEALQGHPSLKVLDLSGNPLAAALVPTISRLVRMTPSLTTLTLDDTLIMDSEREMIRAQCLLNELRLQRAAADGAAATVSDDASSTTSPESVTRGLWAAQMWENVFTGVERGVSAVPWLLGKSTALIRRYGTSQTPQAGTVALERSAGSSTTSDITGRLSQFGSSSVSSLSSTNVAPSLDITYLSYDYTSESAAAAVATVPPPAGATWSAECTEVVRCAFMSPSLAQRTVLGGRSVWPNVPKPLEAVVSPDLAPPSAAAVAATDLLLSLREQVLPEPEAPPGLRRVSAPHATFLTTAEEAYWSVRKKQELQWGYVLQKVSENLTPVSVRNGHTLYVEGSDCDSIYLLPVSLQETGTYAELHVGANPGHVNRVLPGQWVGDAEILDSLSVYAKYPSSAADGSAAVSNSATIFQRSSTVRVVTEATDDVVFWALPFRVAFFYLYAPYQLLHKQFVHRTPMRAFANIHPVHLSCVPVHMHARHGSWKASVGQGRDSGDAPILCRYAFMSRHVLLLEEGEFLLRLPSLHSHVGPRNGDRTAASSRAGMEDHHLLSGVTVLTQPLLDLDAALRAAAAAAELTAENGDAIVTYARGPHGTLAFGKQAELCRFRAAKIENTAASTAVSHSELGENAETTGDSDGNVVVLRQCRTGGTAAQWRYSTITNEEFTSLCPALRVALTRHICVLHDV